jgi:hypothetical protein
MGDNRYVIVKYEDEEEENFNFGDMVEKLREKKKELNYFKEGRDYTKLTKKTKKRFKNKKANNLFKKYRKLKSKISY